MSAVFQAMMTKIAKNIDVDLGDGVTYTYNDKDPYGKEDAQFIKDFRQPTGIGRAALSGLLGALISGGLSAGGTYLINKDHPEAVDAAFRAGGIGATLGGVLGTLSSYGERPSLEEALSALQARREARAKGTVK